MAPPARPVTAPASPEECCDCCAKCRCGTDCATGTVEMQRTYLATNFGSFTLAWYGQLRESGTLADHDFGAGFNILVENWAYVTEAPGNLLAFTWGPSRSLWFDATTLAAKYGARQVLTFDSGANTYRVFDPDSGMAYTFDITSGLLSLVTTPGGQTITNTIDAMTGKITQSVWADEASTVREVRKYVYSSGRLQHATLQTTTSDSTQFARLELTYWGDSTSNGMEGDLRSVSYQLPNGSGGWDTVGTDYFRYYTSNTSPGYEHGLKFVVKPEEFASLGATPDSAGDSTVRPLADAEYEYTEIVSSQNTRRATKSTTLGNHWQTFVYTVNTATATNDFNDWRLKTVVTYKDSSQKIVYSNTVRRVILSDHWALPTNQNLGRWIDYTIYHATYGRVTERYSPASINMSATQYERHADLHRIGAEFGGCAAFERGPGQRDDVLRGAAAVGRANRLR